MTVSKLFKTSKKTSISGDNHRTTTDKPAFKRTPLQKSHSLPSPLSDHSLLTSRRIDLDLKNVKGIVSDDSLILYCDKQAISNTDL